ncbi:pyridoxamine 5'-phosphate oxidase family protein [Sphingomonas lutea]|uniref:Pyridoxamine 5'-phosphate oxidase family protein n=1 Tax=Sphingomonas lutea TaxID=1045317 RepID=A0A7G9SK85_9SPHN|nr:pyridoxamine 5'-phosphate oxidase family protein [Sphingomonas lutea]QNN68260.1 pyridoxamine 5'-phosphate oxidase family protein [Sphingomonas lutea]
MADLKLSDISEKMRDIDFTMLSTRTSDGAIAARPMSNNRQVDYDGDSYFFTCDDTGTVKDISSDPNVGLGFQAKSGLLNMKPFFIAVEGKAELIKDKGQFAEHWTKDLDAWFKEGIDTPGLTMVKVRATRIHYWDGYDEGEIKLAKGAANDRETEAAR